ncbi:MAG: histidine phosphatase family protein [Candidatus Woesearchaeota archaeon]
MKLYLVRHGQSQGNINGFWQGYLPSELTQKGKEQVCCTSQGLKDKNFDAIYSSDLQRAHQTALILQEQYPTTPLHLNPLLREAYLGELEGKPISVRPDWRTNPPIGAETFDKLMNRAKILLEYLYFKHKNDTLLLVAHSGINKAIIQTIRNIHDYDDNLEQKNACVNILEFNGFDNMDVLEVNKTFETNNTD